MSRHRFFLTAAFEGDVLPLSDADVRHASLVLRLRPAEEITAVEPAGRELTVRLTAVSRERLSGDVVGSAETSSVPRVVLVQSVGKGEKMDLVVRAAVEMGVGAIVPLVTGRTVVRLDETKRAARAERWRRIAAQAAKQAQRAFVPSVAEPVRIAGLAAALDEVLGSIGGPKTSPGARHVLVVWEETPGAPGIGEALRSLGAGPDDAVAVVVGPEGGLAAAEVDALLAEGARAVGLGLTILRTETAGMVATALAIYELGGLGGTRAHLERGPRADA